MLIKIRSTNMSRKLIPKTETEVEKIFKEILDYFNKYFTKCTKK
jgi:hypothetical protein